MHGTTKTETVSGTEEIERGYKTKRAPFRGPFLENVALAAILALVALATLSTPAEAGEIRVSREASMILTEKTRRLDPSSYYFEPLPSPDGARYEVSAWSKGALRLMVCDDANFQRFRNGQAYRCHQTKDRGGKLLYAPAAPRSQMFLVLRNENIFMIKEVTWRTRVEYVMSPEAARGTRERLQALDEGMRTLFLMPDFDWSIEPCGQVNASSMAATGDIKLCSELMHEGKLSGNRAASLMPVFHELGHTLLNLWGEPNHWNERTADEFAAVMALMMNKQGQVADWISAFEENEDPLGETRAALRGGPHPLTAQRVAALWDILRWPDQTVRRWTSTLYPHMTTTALRMVVEQGHPGADPELARRILRERGES